MIALIEKSEKRVSDDEMQALARLNRDLIGYIKMHHGHKPDPVKEDLLLQARMPLGVTGL